jgi:hypothetical protein
MKSTVKVLSAIALVVTMSVFTGCVKDRIDAPPSAKDYDPAIPVNTTIAKLKSLANAASDYGRVVTEDITIYGVVVANDISGNFYKQIVIQDSTGGIPLLIEKSGLANEYPVGRKVYVKCQGLTLGAYRGYMQLGYSMDAANSLNGLPLALVGKYVIKANMVPGGVSPRKVTIAELSNPDNAIANKWLGTLIELTDVQFMSGQDGVKYWEAGNTGKDQNLEDCGGANIIVRTSQYADFANVLTPAGKGKLVGVYSRYLSDAQIAVRELADVSLTGERCGDFSANPLVTIASLRAAYAGGDSLNEPLSKIHGVVISDRNAGNQQTRNCVIQDGSAGIVIRFNQDHAFNVGDEIEVNVTNAKVAPYSNTLQVNCVVSQTRRIAAGKFVTPEVVTIKQISDNMSAYESELVSISNVVFPVGTYAGSKIISDGSGGTITLYCASAASYATTTMPTTTKTVTCVPGFFGATKQVLMRNIGDVQ